MASARLARLLVACPSLVSPLLRLLRLRRLLAAAPRRPAPAPTSPMPGSETPADETPAASLRRGFRAQMGPMCRGPALGKCHTAVKQPGWLALFSRLT